MDFTGASNPSVWSGRCRAALVLSHQPTESPLIGEIKSDARDWSGNSPLYHYLVVYDLGLMLSSGFSLSKICEYASQQTPGSLQQFLGAQMQQRLHHGQQLERLIREEPFLPNQLLLLIKTGANRTELSQGCLLLGRTLFLELTQRIEVMVVNIQPICFVLIGISILGLYLKLLLPIYGMMQQL